MSALIPGMKKMCIFSQSKGSGRRKGNAKLAERQYALIGAMYLSAGSWFTQSEGMVQGCLPRMESSLRIVTGYVLSRTTDFHC